MRKDVDILFHLLLSFLIITIILNFEGSLITNVKGQSEEVEKDENSVIIHDPKLKAKLVVSGLDFPTNMAFIGKDDFLILEKETGLVKRVVGGEITEPLLQLPVSGRDERGLLGIDVDKTYSNGMYFTYVFLSFVECESKDLCENKVVRFLLDYNSNKLIYPQELFSVKSFPDDSHMGGVLKVGPDKNIYLTVGDFHGTDFTPIYKTKAQNFIKGDPPDGRGGILRFTQDGDPVSNGILGYEYPLNLYFAYGIRNSFGINFDPLTGYLWDTENGPDYGDEINLVKPGFNSGALKVFGKYNSNPDPAFFIIVGLDIEEEKGPDNLVTFNGHGIYSEPELSWKDTVAPTSITFLDSSVLGDYYQNDMFVANAGGGKIYSFDLSSDRKQLSLSGPLADKVVDSEEEANSVTFAEGFGLITDLEVNPYDGYLYVVAPVMGDSGKGSVYKILPKSTDLLSFPSGIEHIQENPRSSLQQYDNFGKCDEIEMKGKSVWKDLEKGLLTDEQAINLGDQTLELKVANKCNINKVNS
ncbi:MAG TPA: PQQ-dependent sugar dehydrogenase [Nitrososphaeraceae archaeon]|nr:PQQ-dependent sugar dehydrogenase [Nitrososphaeraceae archaeon]